MRRRQTVCLAAATLALLTAGVGRAAPPQEPRIEPVAPKRATPAAERDGGLPFSGLDLALLTAGGGPLLLIGASLRRRQPKAKVKPSSEETLTLA